MGFDANLLVVAKNTSESPDSRGLALCVIKALLGDAAWSRLYSQESTEAHRLCTVPGEWKASGAAK